MSRSVVYTEHQFAINIDALAGRRWASWSSRAVSADGGRATSKPCPSLPGWDNGTPQLRRLGRSRLPREPRPPVVRYERERPGELLHIDTKKLGRFWHVGKRICRDGVQRSPRAGWQHVHVAVDDHTRLAYAEVLPSDRRGDAVAFLERALRWYAAQGITVEAVMTDNGSAYRSRAWLERCTQLGLRHLRTRPYTPRTNGKAERFIQTLLRGWAYGFAYPSSQHRTRALSGWLRWSTDAGPTARLVVSRPSAVSHRSVVTTSRRSFAGWRRGAPAGGGPHRGRTAGAGIDASASTVRGYRRQALRRPPSPSWRTFLRLHAPEIWAADFVTVRPLTFRRCTSSSFAVMTDAGLCIGT